MTFLETVDSKGFSEQDVRKRGEKQRLTSKTGAFLNYVGKVGLQNQTGTLGREKKRTKGGVLG